MENTVTIIDGKVYNMIHIKNPCGKCQKCAFNGSSDYSENGCDVNSQFGCAGIVFKEAK